MIFCCNMCLVSCPLFLLHILTKDYKYIGNNPFFGLLIAYIYDFFKQGLWLWINSSSKNTKYQQKTLCLIKTKPLRTYFDLRFLYIRQRNAVYYRHLYIPTTTIYSRLEWIGFFYTIRIVRHIAHKHQVTPNPSHFRACILIIKKIYLAWCKKYVSPFFLI